MVPGTDLRVGGRRKGRRAVPHTGRSSGCTRRGGKGGCPSFLGSLVVKHERSERTSPGGLSRSGGVPTMHRQGVLGARLCAVGGSNCATTMDWARTIWETSVRALRGAWKGGSSSEGANRARGSRRVSERPTCVGTDMPSRIICPLVHGSRAWPGVPQIHPASLCNTRKLAGHNAGA